MRLNEFTVITGNSVVLVPYEEFHVPKYHEWMKSEELQILTASEPLTFEEECNMQKSWREDPDKCTFIVLDKKIYDETKNEVKSMIGDTNVFLKYDNKKIMGEIEIMIAVEAARGKGLGKEAVSLMLRYGGVEKLNINVFEAKVGIENSKSISLFSSLGFKKVNENQVFKECTLSINVAKPWTEFLKSVTKHYNESTRKI